MITSETHGPPPEPSVHGQRTHPRAAGGYDGSKRLGETLTIAHNDAYDLNVRTVRIFNAYGPQMRPDDGRVVPTLLSQALQGEELTVYGDGSQTRAFCYVDDMVDGLRAVMETDEMRGNVMNVGGENEISIRTLAEQILEVCDIEGDVVYEPLPEDDPTRRRPDIPKALSMLDWEPTVDLETGLARCLEHFESA